MDNLHFFISSEDYRSSTYPSNKINDFTIDLTETYNLEGQYECSLIDVMYTKKKGNSGKILYIFCDLCDDSYVREHRLPILRVIDTRRRDAITPIYMNMKTRQFNKLRIYITDESLSHNSVVNLSSLRCTLHIRKKTL